MKRHHVALSAVGLLGVAGAANCDGNGGSRPDYVTKKEFEALRGQYVATHDTMLALWRATDSLNKIFGQFAIGKYGAYPVPKPPKCPPACEELIPPIPPVMKR